MAGARLARSSYRQGLISGRTAFQKQFGFFMFDVICLERRWAANTEFRFESNDFLMPVLRLFPQVGCTHFRIVQQILALPLHGDEA